MCVCWDVIRDLRRVSFLLCLIPGLCVCVEGLCFIIGVFASRCGCEICGGLGVSWCGRVGGGGVCGGVEWFWLGFGGRCVGFG